jgi:hypothetical protein
MVLTCLYQFLTAYHWEIWGSHSSTHDESSPVVYYTVLLMFWTSMLLPFSGRSRLDLPRIFECSLTVWLYYKFIPIWDLQSLLKNNKSNVCRLQVMLVMLLPCKHMLYALFKQNEVHPIQAGKNLRLSSVSKSYWNDSYLHKQEFQFQFHLESVAETLL